MNAVSKKLVTITGLFCMWCASPSIYAYEIETHSGLSNAAYDNSVLSQSNFLKSLGISASDVFGKGRATYRLNTGTARGWIREGSVVEDDSTRSLNHFYDPLRNRGLFGVNVASPDWALEDARDVDSQVFSYKDARDYLYQALISSTEAARKQFFGKTFQTLGQVIHHLQDMAQPQHVRNDAHCDAIFPCLIPGGLFGLYSPSLYEDYTNDHRGNLPYTGYAPAIFPGARAFWTGNGAGIADYTNHNFLSAGTNFDTRRYPNPFLRLATEREENANTLLADAGLPIPAECLPPAAPCVMTFYGNLVQDRYRPAETRDNPRASTWSVFDQDLKLYNQTFTRTDPDTGQTYTATQAFSLNRFNFDEAHTFLIPRAVGYSAGLVDYFFRGRLEGEDVEFTATGLRLRVKNALDTQKTPTWSEEPLYASRASGASTLIVSYDYKDATGATCYGTSLEKKTTVRCDT